MAAQWGYAYSEPFTGEETEKYPAEPTDPQATIVARAIAHWLTAYPSEKDISAQAIVLDILESNVASTDPMSRDECVAIANAVGVEV